MYTKTLQCQSKSKRVVPFLAGGLILYEVWKLSVPQQAAHLLLFSATKRRRARYIWINIHCIYSNISRICLMIWCWRAVFKCETGHSPVHYVCTSPINTGYLIQYWWGAPVTNVPCLWGGFSFPRATAVVKSLWYWRLIVIWFCTYHM